MPKPPATKVFLLLCLFYIGSISAFATDGDEKKTLEYVLKKLHHLEENFRQMNETLTRLQMDARGPKGDIGPPGASEPVAQFLSELNIDVYSPDSLIASKDTVLLNVCKSNSTSDKLPAALRWLISIGADVNAKDEDYYNALIWLCREYHNNDKLLKAARILINSGIDAKAVSKYGNTALTLLCRYNIENDQLLDVAKLLIANGVDVNQKNSNGFNPLMLLSVWSSPKSDNAVVEVARLLFASGIDTKATNKDGNNALMLLCEKSKSEKLEELVSLFINHGVDPKTKNNAGWTAADLLRSRRDEIIARNNKTKILELLEKGGTGTDDK